MSLPTAAASSVCATPDLRMVEALLTSCDPCGVLATGSCSTSYADVAVDVLEAMRAGDDVADLILHLPPDADAAAALRFARVAADWWDNCLAAQDRILGAAQAHSGQA